MNDLEDALRGAFDSELGTPADRLIGDVRRGAQQRRARRTTAVAAGAVVAVVATVAIGAAALRGNGAEPDLTPQPSPSVSGTAPPPAPGRFAVAAEASGGALWVTARESDCGCVALWRHEGEEWMRVQDFPGRWISELAFSPDGRFGLAGDGARIWMTSDSGRTWERAKVPDSFGPAYVVAASRDHFWVRDATAQNPAVQARFGSDDFTPFELPSTGVLTAIVATEDRVVLELVPPGEGDAGFVLFTSTDEGRTWSEMSVPCVSDHQWLAPSGALFVLCTDPGGRAGGTVHRWVDGGWQEFGAFDTVVTDVEPLTPDRILLSGQRDLLLTADGARPVDLGLSRNATVFDSATDGANLYLTTSGGIRVSTDGGVSWGPVE